MKKAIIIAVIALILIGGGLTYKFLKPSVKSDVASNDEPTPEIQALPTISSDVVVDLKPKSNNQSVILHVKGIPSGIDSIEYELTYTTAAGLPRGVLGKITLKSENEVSRDDIVLGTCSSGHCVYDTGVKTVDLSLKFNSSDGPKVFQKTYTLE